ncbi:hypothetical protein K469DRAFT_564497 [Zopfia rhizophila CBS 207.26]|uniref:Uncharacterized protein n=1 Tax=Zopfia rhizophila CBS 207.26 TaxID=1314779 RepID=A0A6A6EC96_9PEZI|nr:hypothetical protein K469DRAFT_564497 [Zopfia rhizophila CBS 207.26]
MPDIRKRKYFTTPPPIIAPDEHAQDQQSQLENPQRSAVIAIAYFCQMEGIPQPFKKLEGHFKIPTSTTNDILRSKRQRRL